MERKIGEIFEHSGEWYQCIQGNCEVCDFSRDEHTCLLGVSNCVKFRKNNDCKAVAFKKLEKFGEPYTSSRNKKRYQLYRCLCLPIITKDRRIEIGDANWVGIEIKQNKEDMEESKPKLKEFDLEAAKAGKPVCTRDGRKARIICFDAKGDKPIIALIEMGVAETPNNYPIDGKAISTKETPCDLMMLPEKKEGWVNVYNDIPIYDSKEEALNRRSEFRGYIDTVKVSWEE